MNIGEVAQIIFQYGGTVIMAFLFIWVFVQDKTKNEKLQEDNHEMLKLLTKGSETLTESNNNIAKSLDIISQNLVTIDTKIDRNYEANLKK